MQGELDGLGVRAIGALPWLAIAGGWRADSEPLALRGEAVQHRGAETG